MPLYLARFSYTTDAMKALVDQPQDRSAAAREAMAVGASGALSDMDEAQDAMRKASAAIYRPPAGFVRVL
jgi:hypothetical protein